MGSQVDPGVDQRGFVRLRDGDGAAICDIGAVEVQLEPIFADGLEP
ncbi:MAG: choice-of-anchor Q domain-containing protein [Pseudomarimonas sp.]